MTSELNSLRRCKFRVALNRRHLLGCSLQFWCVLLGFVGVASRMSTKHSPYLHTYVHCIAIAQSNKLHCHCSCLGVRLLCWDSLQKTVCPLIFAGFYIRGGGGFKAICESLHLQIFRPGSCATTQHGHLRV